MRSSGWPTPTPRATSSVTDPRPTRGAVAPGLLAIVAIGALLTAGCASKSPSSSNPSSSNRSEVESSAPASDTGSGPDSGATSGATSGTTLGGIVVAADAVTCVRAPRSDFGAVIGVAGAPEVPCDQPHDHESFSLPDSTDLDDCVRAAAASSDLTLGTSSSGGGDIDIDDDRLVGHLFASAATSGIECGFDLRDDRSDPLIGR